MEIIRSWLIAPANRPEYIGKFATLGADCSVMDLDDGTTGQFKQAARDNLPNLVKQLRAQGLSQGLFVRTNHPRSEHYPKELAEAAGAAADRAGLFHDAALTRLRVATSDADIASADLVQVVSGSRRPKDGHITLGALAAHLSFHRAGHQGGPAGRDPGLHGRVQERAQFIGEPYSDLGAHPTTIPR